jgi:hypothetical protein
MKHACVKRKNLRRRGIFSTSAAITIIAEQQFAV